jgi:hypothetical protein
MNLELKRVICSKKSHFISCQMVLKTTQKSIFADKNRLLSTKLSIIAVSLR